MPPNKSNLLDEFNALTSAASTRTLSGEEQQRLELLRDVLLELSASSPTPTFQARHARVEAVLEVSFSSKDEVARAYSKDIGAGGIAIRTTRVLAVGSAIGLRIKLSGSDAAINAQGRVAWAREGEMGVEFVQIAAPDDARLRQHLVGDVRLLSRLRTVLTTDVRELGKVQAPDAVSASELDTRPLVVVALSDPHEQGVVTEVLQQGGVRVAPVSSGMRPAVIVADTGTVLTITIAVGVRLVMMNVSGPDALTGKHAQLRPAAFIRRRAPVLEVLQAVTRLMTELRGR